MAPGTKSCLMCIPISNGDTQNRNHTFEGIINNLERRYRETQSEWIKEKMEKYMRITTCPSCKGNKLKPELLAVTVGGKEYHGIL